MRVVLVVQLGRSGLLRASLAQLGVLVAHLDQNGVFGAWSTSTVARDGRRLRVCLHLLACGAQGGQGTATSGRPGNGDQIAG